MDTQIKTDMKRYNHLITETDAAYHEAARKLGLSDSAMMILYTICNEGEECLLSDITYLSGVSKQTVNSALRKLEEEGVVFLETAGGKKKKVRLTDKGKKLVDNTVHKVIDIENRIFGSWSKEEWEKYLELIERYLVAFNEEIKNL